MERFLNVQPEISKETIEIKQNAKTRLFVEYHFRMLNHFRRYNSVTNYASLSNKSTQTLALQVQVSLASIIPKKLDDDLKENVTIEIERWFQERYVASNLKMSELIGIDSLEYGYRY